MRGPRCVLAGTARGPNPTIAKVPLGPRSSPVPAGPEGRQGRNGALASARSVPRLPSPPWKVSDLLRSRVVLSAARSVHVEGGPQGPRNWLASCLLISCMSTRIRRSAIVVFGLLALRPLASEAQGMPPSASRHDRHLASTTTLTALRNDVRRLDEMLNAIIGRPEHPGLELEAVAIRHDVSLVEDQVREHLAGRHDGTGAGTADVNWLRQRISRLRRSIQALPARPSASPR